MGTCIYCNTVAPPRCAQRTMVITRCRKKKYACKINENNSGYGGVKNSGENKASPLQRCLNITRYVIIIIIISMAGAHDGL